MNGSDTASTHREIWFESDGARLYAKELGEGSPVVFLHGGLADHRAALFRAGSVASACRLIAPDLRGSGRSVHAGALSWDQLVDDVSALLDHLGLDRAVVGGTSMGSGVALRFALRHPERTKGVLLVSPLYPGADRGLAEAPRAAMRAMAEAGEKTRLQGVEALRPLYAPLPSPIREAAIEMMLGFDPASVAATTRFLASCSQPLTSASDLETLAVPAIVVPGTDPEHPADVAALYARHLRQCLVLDPTHPDLVQAMTRFYADL